MEKYGKQYGIREFGVKIWKNMETNMETNMEFGQFSVLKGSHQLFCLDGPKCNPNPPKRCPANLLLEFLRNNKLSESYEDSF